MQLGHQGARRHADDLNFSNVVVPLLGDASNPLFAAAGLIEWRQSQLNRQIVSSSKLFCGVDRGNDSGCSDWTDPRYLHQPSASASLWA